MYFIKYYLEIDISLIRTNTKKSFIYLPITLLDGILLKRQKCTAISGANLLNYLIIDNAPF